MKNTDGFLTPEEVNYHIENLCRNCKYAFKPYTGYSYSKCDLLDDDFLVDKDGTCDRWEAKGDEE